MQILIDRKGTNKSRSTKVVNLNSGGATHYPGLNGFAFAIAVTDRYANIMEWNQSLFNIVVDEYLATRTGVEYTFTMTNIPVRL